MNGIIYCYTSPSGKQYIGQTVNESRRKAYHKYQAFSLNAKTIFHVAIRKYGFENFKYEVLHKNLTSKSEMNILEEMEILNRNTLAPNGYNLNSGGLSHIPTKEVCKKMYKNRIGIRPNEEKRKKMSDWKIGRNRTDDYRKKLSEAKKGKKHTEQSKINMGRSHFKKVICIETGIIYDSIKEAGELTSASKQSISCACRCVYETAGGYHWEYYIEGNDYSKIKIDKPKKILCVETGDLFDTIKEASDKTNNSRQNIGQCLNGKRKRCGGFHWERV